MTDIIKVEKKDIKELAALAKDIWFEYWHALLTLGQIYYMVNKFQSEIALAEQMEYENYEYYFVVEDGKKAGYFGIAPEKDYLFLSKFYMAQEYRYKGIGRLVFEMIKKMALEKNFKKIQLTVNRQNIKSVEIYEKWGFKLLHPLVTRIGNGYEMDDYVMEYKISEEEMA